MATILFVDDDEMERYFAREILEPRGHRVLYAGDGESALRVYDQEEVDVVVTDLAMPRLNGLRLIQKLRERDRHVRIIAASGINADQLDMAEDFGAFTVLQKPWDPKRFLEVLQTLMERDTVGPNAFERVWPTVFSDMAINEEGRLVRKDEEGDPTETEADERPAEEYDLGLDKVRLEVEGDESAPEIEVDDLSLDLDEPD